MVDSSVRLNESLRSGFFTSRGWMRLLESGLEAKLVEINILDSASVIIPVFQKGPFRVAYPGFPVGELAEYENYDWESLICQDFGGKPWDMMRLWQSNLLNPLRLVNIRPSSWLYETSIKDLQSWDSSGLPSSVKRNIKKARKMGVQVVSATSDDAPSIYNLYSKMITLRKGALRYTLSYFRELSKLSMNSPNVTLKVAILPERSVVSMLAIIYSGSNAYYMHGATDVSYRNARPADLLMHNAISQAKENGMDGFSFLPSPAGQPGLIRFKEKWGGATSATPVFDIYKKSLRGKILNAAVEARKHIYR